MTIDARRDSLDDEMREELEVWQSLRVLIENLAHDFRRHVEQEDRNRDSIRGLIERIDVRLAKLEHEAVADDARAKFVSAIGNIVLKSVTLITIIIGAVVAILRFKS